MAPRSAQCCDEGFSDRRGCRCRRHPGDGGHRAGRTSLNLRRRHTKLCQDHSSVSPLCRRSGFQENRNESPISRLARRDLVVSAAIWCATMPIAAQSPATTRDVQAIKEAERKLIKEVADGLKKRDAALSPQAEVPKNWKPARTAWGDPDLTGVYSNSDEAGIPFETGPVRRPPARGHHRSRAEPAPASATKRDARTRGQRLGRSRGPPAAVLVGNPERHEQPRVARPRPAGRKSPAGDAGGTAARRLVRTRDAEADTAPLTPRRTAACTTGASREACRAR